MTRTEPVPSSRTTSIGSGDAAFWARACTAMIATLHAEDPTFHYHVDDELHETVVSGLGEIHLQVVVERLLRRFGVTVDLTHHVITGSIPASSSPFSSAMSPAWW